ncbi:MAG: 5'-methylthioadenosine/adenosylhomocysteine nucleosidase [Rhodospirillaceae bacterium]|nr:5'-methylthioadenosine/adenosylhomocysteine nucleosidase [Rhodospirillaceae bacterium]
MTTFERPLGILCALPQEMQLLATSLAESRPDERAGTTFLSGALDGCAVTIAEGGIGKVGSALAATLLLERFNCRTLIFTGVAGGLDPALGIGDIVIAERLIQHDYGSVVGDAHVAFRGGDFPLGGTRRDPAFALDPLLLERLKAGLAGYAPPMLAASVIGKKKGRQPRLVFGTVVTGDVFVNSAAMRERLRERWSAQAVEMEGAAVAQVAERFGVPAIVIRALSDLAGAESHMDFGQFLDVASEAAADVVRRVVRIVG